MFHMFTVYIRASWVQGLNTLHRRSAASTQENWRKSGGWRRPVCQCIHSKTDSVRQEPKSSCVSDRNVGSFGPHRYTPTGDLFAVMAIVTIAPRPHFCNRICYLL